MKKQVHNKRVMQRVVLRGVKGKSVISAIKGIAYQESAMDYLLNFCCIYSTGDQSKSNGILTLQTKRILVTN